MLGFLFNITRLHLLLVLLAGLTIATPSFAKRATEEVFHYQKHMAQAGYPSAIHKLAVMYQNGYGTPRNLEKSLKLYEESFKMGYEQSESRINEVKLMIQSGDFDTPSKASEAEKPKLETGGLKARKAKVKDVDNASNAEQLKLKNMIKLLRAENAQLEEEKRQAENRRRLKAKKQLEKWRNETSAMEESE